MGKTRSKDPNRKLSPGTFGSSPACHILVDMMNRNVILPAQKHKVLSFIEDAIVEFNALLVIEHPAVREKVMIRSRNYYIQRVEDMVYPEKFKCLLKNVIHYIFKKSLREATWTIAP